MKTSKLARSAILSIVRQAFQVGPAQKLLIDSANLQEALAGWEPDLTFAGKRDEVRLHGCKITRWIFPFGELIVPLENPGELLKRVNSADTVCEKDYPAEMAILKLEGVAPGWVA